LLRQAGIRDRKVWLFDSFEGLPAPEAIDGPAALSYVRGTRAPHYFDNCRASLEEVRETAARLGLAGHTEFVKGWFEDSLPAHRHRLDRIAILRVDADWYRSVRDCLEQLYDQVSDGGLVTLDDYYAYDGCAAAVHEFLAERQLPHRIESVAGGPETPGVHPCAVFRKGAKTWLWMRQLFTIARELASIVPRGALFLLADEAQLEGAVPAGRRVLPFLERDGQYWGAPADDGSAIAELERLRRAGAELLVFAWPAFWWLEHYPAFRQHLVDHYRCSLQSERIVAFDLRPGDAAEALAPAGPPQVPAPAS
ncbi:MAG TPA: TylF/MycF/NovP-related O-methyltransferase, partial [Solirubrobacterales bacterium]|nr:TylF/MycF/NovP-related O-methyltransferase [Solirubrobacterales bacterium]